MTTFAKLLAGLTADGVRFIVVGGLAVARAGWERHTEDADILIDADPGNVQRLIASLTAFDPGAADLEADDFSLEEGAVRIVGPFPLDVFTQMTGYTYADFLPRSVAFEVLGTLVLFLGRDALIELKRDSYREKDRLDVANLRRLPPDTDL